jgi:hypothetical protein
VSCCRPDLDTGSPTVRQKIANYLIMLARLGSPAFASIGETHPAGGARQDLAIVDST